jgi:eukaryotic-like serine/threonine-protein kinase
MDEPRQLGGALGDPRRLLGQVISGRYRVDELVGGGGMGAIYRAENIATRSRVAIKVLHLEMLGNAEAVARFEREAVALGRVVHPNIAAAHDVGRLDDGSCFLVLDYLEGEVLRAVIQRGALAPDRALRVARQIALGLDAVHAIGIVHRDLKPENVMLARESAGPEVVKVLDFGIAKVPEAHDARRAPGSAPLTQMGVAYGTLEYMAPEQALGGNVDARADLYALGVMLYEMLSGYRPFDAPDRAELTRLVTTTPPPPLAPRVPGGALPPALEALVTRLLRKEAGARFNSARDVVTAIDGLVLPTPALINASSLRSDQATMAARPMPALEAVHRGSAPTIAAGRASPSAARGSIVAQSPRASLVISDGPVEQVMATLPGPLRGVPAQALLSWLGLLGILAIAIVAVSLRSSKTIDALEERVSARGASASSAGAASAGPSEDDAPAAPTTAPSADLDAARAEGLVALGPLAQKFPSDPAVLKALMLAHASDKAGYSAAVGVARRLFDVAPASTSDEDVHRVLLLAANGPPDVAAQAFELISSKMGSAGPDLLFDLVTTPSTAKYPKERAAKQLEDPAVRALASPALVIALELRAALPCGRKPLLARARESGDARSLSYLKQLLPTTGCGFFRRGDCFDCFGNRSELRETITAIEARRAPL